jgi:hypothetical protein
LGICAAHQMTFVAIAERDALGARDAISSI